MCLTYRTFRVGLDNAAEVCDGLFRKVFLPVQHVPATKQLMNISLKKCWHTKAKNLVNSHRGKSAMSLTSAITSLWSNTMCLRSCSFSEAGKESEQSAQVTGWPSLEEVREALPHRCSGKQSGSRIQSCLANNERKHNIHTFNKIWCTNIFV